MIGYRVWDILHTRRKGFRLFSTVFRVEWERDMKAVCDRGTLESDLTRMEHTCGLYSYKSPSILLSEEEDVNFTLDPTLSFVAVGVVFNYGIVIEYSKGYRSSHSLIDTIFLPRFACIECWPYIIRGAEFLLISPEPSRPKEPVPVCLQDYLSRRKEWEKFKAFPIEAIKIDLERNYQLPVRDLKELVGEERLKRLWD